MAAIVAHPARMITKPSIKSSFFTAEQQTLVREIFDGMTNPDWRERWQGKKLRDEAGRLRIGVAKGPVEPGSPEAAYLVDGISGATRTGQGVADLLRFWLGDQGFGPYLDRIRP